MRNVLDQHRQQQIVALERLGWSLRRIEETPGRPAQETASENLKRPMFSYATGTGWPTKSATMPDVSTD